MQFNDYFVNSDDSIDDDNFDEKENTLDTSSNIPADAQSVIKLLDQLDSEAKQLTTDFVLNSLKQIEEMHSNSTQLQDQLMRKTADLDNIRKRSQIEISQAKQYSMTSFANDLLKVLDSFEMAINTENTKTHSEETNSDEFNKTNSLYSGVINIHREILGVLKSSKIVPIETKGCDFDPEIHMTVGSRQENGVNAGVILEEARRGYMIADRCLRPSLVIVAE
jgi:molecular chaperone GrpE